MSVAFHLIVLLGCLLPATFFLPPNIAQSSLGLAAAVALAATGASARSIDIEAFARAVRFCKLAATLPAVWILLQLLPLPIGNAAIWSTSDAMLDRGGWGHITGDIGDSWGALLFYLALVALVMATILLATDRTRAHVLLIASTVGAVLSAFIFLIAESISSTLLRDLAGHNLKDALAATSALGLILSTATSPFGNDSRGLSITRHWVLSSIAMALCLIGLSLTAQVTSFMIAISGTVVYCLIRMARRLSIPPRSLAITLLVVTMAVLIVPALRDDNVSRTSLWLRYASRPGNVTVAQRALDDASALGTGAGSYRAVIPIYQELGATDANPPTTMAALAIQLGWPFTILILILAAQLLFVLVRGAMLRLRDSVFPATSAACVVGIAGQAFYDASIVNHPGIAVVSAVLVGIGLAQSFRRSSAAG